MSENVIPLQFRLKPRPVIGRWTVERIALAELPGAIVEIAESLEGSTRSAAERDRWFALLVLAACSNALYEEG